MKFCPKCGCENPDQAKFCVDCGEDLGKISQPRTTKQKNKWVGVILDIIGGLISYFLVGIGQIFYLKLYKRGLIFCTIGALIVAFNMFLQFITGGGLFITFISLILGMGWAIYAAYDAYKCVEAINGGNPIPPLFNINDPESMSRQNHIALIVIFIVALLIAGYLAVVTVSSEISDDSSFLTDIGDDTSVSDEGLVIKISCPVEWSASVGDTDTSTMYEGSGDDVIEIDGSQYDTVAAAVQKKTGGSDKLEVEILKDGDVVDSESTTKDYGVVTVSTTI